jgi:hypothetical protein
MTPLQVTPLQVTPLQVLHFPLLAAEAKNDLFTGPEAENDPFTGLKATRSVVADVHHPPADRAITIKDVELVQSEIRILGPGVWHPAGLHAMMRSIHRATRQEVTRARAEILALLRVVEIICHSTHSATVR